MFSGENSIIQCSQPLEGSSLSVILLDCKWTDQGLQARGAERGQRALGPQQAGAVGSSWTLMGVGPLMSKPRRVRGPQGGSADNHSPFHAWGNPETQKCQSAPGACSPPGAVVDGGRGSLIQGLFQVLEAPPKPPLGPPAPAAHTASAAPLAGTVALWMQHHRRAGHRAERQAGAGSPSPLLFKQPWLQLHYPPTPPPYSLGQPLTFGNQTPYAIPVLLSLVPCHRLLLTYCYHYQSRFSTSSQCKVEWVQQIG